MKQNQFLFARCLTLLVLALLSTNLAWGETTIYSETFGNNTTSSAVAWSSASNYFSDTNTKTIANTSSWKIGKASANECNISDSSGDSGGMCGSTSGEITFTFGDISNYSDLTFSVNWHNNAGKSKARTFSIQISSDGGSTWGSNLISVSYLTTQEWRTFSHELTSEESKNFAVKITNTSNNTSYIDDVKLIGTLNPTKIPTAVTVSGTPTKTSYFAGEEFDPAGLTVTATYAEGDEDVTSGITWTFDPDPLTAGTTSVNVTATVGGVQSEAYQVNGLAVKNIANTKETAYTVEEAIALIDANPAELATTEVYVKGTVSKIDSYNSQYKSITYWLDNDAFEVYSGKNLNNTDFASKDDVTVGDDVVVYGIIKKYTSSGKPDVYEFDKNNYLVSHVKASTLEIKDITVEINGDITPVIETNVVGDYTMSYTSNNENVVLADGDEMVTMGLGTATITATLTAEGYKDATTTFTVEVIKALTSIEVKTAPTTSYKAGDKFNPAGLVITAKYNDNTTEDVTYAGNEESFTFEPSLETALTTENNSVIITYAGQTTTQTIEVRSLYTYDITWMANGEQFTTTHVTEGDALVLPETNPESINDYLP